MEIWILQTGEPIPGDPKGLRPMRASNLIEELSNRGHTVTFFTSAFSHQLKVKRDIYSPNYRQIPNLEIVFLNSRGYKKNLDVSRILDHKDLAKSLSIELNHRIQKPNAIIIGYPPISVAHVLAKWATKRNVPYLVDMKDLWPEIFEDYAPIGLKWLAKLILRPLYKIQSSIIENSAGVVAPSISFLSVCLNYATRQKTDFDQVFPLASKLKPVTKIETSAQRQQHRRDILFIGAHSDIYDFDTVFKCATILEGYGLPILFKIFGSGTQTSKMQRNASKLKNVQFLGYKGQSEIVELSKNALCTIAPYSNRKDFINSIPNKISDSLALGLPIISPLDGEVRHLIEDYRVGMAYAQGSASEMAKCISKLFDQKDLHEQLSTNCLRLYEEKFCHQIVYRKYCDMIESMG